MKSQIAILSAFVALSGCSLIAKLGKDSKRDVADARDRGDRQALSKICKNTSNDHDIRSSACFNYIHLSEKNKDVGALKKMCADADVLSDSACKIVKRIRGQALLKTIASVKCSELAAFKDEYGGLLTWGSLKRDVRDANLLVIVERMIECDRWDYVIQNLAHMGSVSNRNHMGPVPEGMGTTLQRSLWSNHDLEAKVFAYAEKQAKPWAFGNSRYFLKQYMDVLLGDGTNPRKPAACDKYASFADGASSKIFPSFARYLQVHKCVQAAAIVAKRLASDDSYAREAACTILGVIGNKQAHHNKLRTLGFTDQGTRLKLVGGERRRYYPVREACQSAANKLAVR